MRRPEELLPQDLDIDRPGLATLLQRVLRRLPEDEYARIGAALGACPSLQDLWQETGCTAHFAFAVVDADLRPTPRSDDPATHVPVLSDACFSFVGLGRRGRRSLALALAFTAGGEAEATRVRVPRAVVRDTVGLRFAPRREGVFLAARFLAHKRGREVRPEDLFDVLSSVVTPSLRGALGDIGARVEALDDAAANLLEELGRLALARLREVVTFPAELLSLPDTWDLQAVRTMSHSPIIPEFDTDLPDLDANWLVSRYLWLASPAGIPGSRRVTFNAPVPTARAVLCRYAEHGWASVFAGALRAAGWEPAIVDADGCTAHELVKRGLTDLLPDALRSREEAPHVREEDPVERARAEFAELRDALAGRVIGSGIVDRLALVALAHRRGVGDRLLLTGQSGAGKSFVARTVAEVVGVPFFVQDATGLTETGYRGLNVPDLIDAMYRHTGSDKGALESSVLVLDEIEKIRIAPGVDGVSLDKRWGMQSCALSLLQGGTPIAAGEGSLVVDTRRMLIVCTGAFSDAAWADERAPSTQDLVQYGLIRELAERLRNRIFLPPRTAAELAEVLRRSDESVETVVGPLAAELGIELRVLPSAYRVVARMVVAGQGGMGLRSGNQVLVAAGHRSLLRALGENGNPIALVTPDDLDLLPRARR